MTRARDLSLAAAIVVWATILGGIVYSHMVWFPPYLAGLPKTATLAATIHDESFWLTVHPLAILSLVITLALNWTLRPRRKLITCWAISSATKISSQKRSLRFKAPCAGTHASSRRSAATWHSMS